MNKHTKISDTAVIHENVTIEDDVVIHDYVVIYPNVVIKKGTEIFDHAVIGKLPTSPGSLARPIDKEFRRLVINENCVVCPGAVIHAGAVIGNNTLIGDNSSISENVLTGGYCVVGKNTNVGNNTTIGHHTKVMGCTTITGNMKVGSHVFISINVATTNDNYMGEKGYDEDLIAGPIIEDYVKVGASACLLPNISIGRNTTIGACTLVTADMPENAVVMGIPGRIVRQKPQDSGAYRDSFYRKWREYTNRFDEVSEYIELKSKHMIKVADIMDELSCRMNLDQRMSKLAWITGLYHDVGRYEQMKRYGVFQDIRSVDHGDLSAEIVKSEDLLEELSEADREIVLAAIRNHNKFKIEEGLEEDALILSKLIRDADKADIFRVINEESTEIGFDASTEQLEKSSISEGVYSCIMNHSCVKHTDIGTPLDRILCCMAYIFDINFRESFELINEQGYYLCGLDSLAVKNPETERKTDEILKTIRTYVKGKPC